MLHQNIHKVLASGNRASARMLATVTVNMTWILLQGFSSPRVRLPTETSAQSAGPRPLKRKASDALPAEDAMLQLPRKQGPLREVLTNGSSSPLPSSQGGSISEEGDYSSDAHQTPSTGKCTAAQHCTT